MLLRNSVVHILPIGVHLRNAGKRLLDSCIPDSFILLRGSGTLPVFAEVRISAFDDLDLEAGGEMRTEKLLADSWWLSHEKRDGEGRYTDLGENGKGAAATE